MVKYSTNNIKKYFSSLSIDELKEIIELDKEVLKENEELNILSKDTLNGLISGVKYLEKLIKEKEKNYN